MSGSDAGQMMCSCPISRCLTGNCGCVKAKLPCSGACKFYNCQNTENRDRPTARKVNVCRCKKNKCASKRSCFGLNLRCTSKCKCQDCTNGVGLGRSGAKAEQGQGSEDSLSNIPRKAAQTTPPRDNRGSASNKRPRNQPRVELTGTLVKFLAMIMFSLLLTTGTAARPITLAPVREAGRNPKLMSVTGSVIGCTPKRLARDLALLCQKPYNAEMPIENCCGLALGTVARPACFCLVSKEPVFGMTELRNVSNLQHLLSRCGASQALKQTIDNPCHRSESAETSSTRVSSCKRYKVSTYVGWALVVIVSAAAVWVHLSRREPAAPRARDMEMNIRDDEPRTSNSSTDSIHPDDSSLTEDDLLVVDGKRKRMPNRKFIGGLWCNGPVKKYKPKRK